MEYPGYQLLFKYQKSNLINNSMFLNIVMCFYWLLNNNSCYILRNFATNYVSLT